MLTETNNRISRSAAIDDLFDSRRTKEYRLAIQIGADELSAAVLDEVYNKIIALEKFTFQKVFNPTVLAGLITNIIKQSEILSYPFKNVSLSILSAKSTLVPNALYDSDEKEALLKFNHSLESGETIGVDNLPNLSAKNIYALPKVIEQQFKELYRHLNIAHYSSSLIEQVILTNKHSSSTKVVVHVHFESFDILVGVAGKLLFYNSFNFRAPEDFIYYVLFVFEQLKLNPETIPVELLGAIEKDSSVYRFLYKYIRNLSFGDRPDAFEYSFKISELPRHYYYGLLSRFLFT